MTEREMYLLNEIELLKNRLGELESRLTSGFAKPAAPLIAAPSEAALPVPIPAASTAPTQDTQQAAAVDTKRPFAFGDFTWLNGNPRTKDSVLDSKYFTGEFRVDTSYIYDYNHPIHHTLTGTTEGTRTGEFQVQDVGVGGDFHAGNMQGRFLTQFGMYSTATPRNDASPSVGQWNLSDATATFRKPTAVTT